MVLLITAAVAHVNARNTPLTLSSSCIAEHKKTAVMAALFFQASVAVRRVFKWVTDFSSMTFVFPSATPRQPTTCWTCSPPSSSHCRCPPPTHGEVRVQLFLWRLSSQHNYHINTHTHTHVSHPSVYSQWEPRILCTLVIKVFWNSA